MRRTTMMVGVVVLLGSSTSCGMSHEGREQAREAERRQFKAAKEQELVDFAERHHATPVQLLPNWEGLDDHNAVLWYCCSVLSIPERLEVGTCGPRQGLRHAAQGQEKQRDRSYGIHHSFPLSSNSGARSRPLSMNCVRIRIRWLPRSAM